MQQAQSQSIADVISSNADWRKAYTPLPSSFDEMFTPTGALHPHWERFVESMDKLGRAEVARRWELARRMIHENGVTYNVHGDPHGLDRPWVLDAVPLMFSAREWSGIERALAQRAQLLNAVLADLYGPQKLLQAGLLPAELVFAHPLFLRPCHNILPSGGRHLHLFSADIGRTPDGNWWVLNDRSQAPAGAGYALENRIVLSRIFPDIFKECSVQRLANFFRRLRDTLAASAPYNRDNPRIVLFSPGPQHETYFEHVYLSRYLNYTLVEGGDLTVRDQAVYLKTLGGLHRVDVVLRRMDDNECDPLELAPDSFLGVPGLVQAIRAGNVAVSNALGCGLVESPAFKPFLPALCKHFFNEELLMPSVQSYWCGQPASLAYVLENLEKLIVKPAFPGRGVLSQLGSKLSRAELSELREKIKARPLAYVAQEHLHLSTAPVLVDNRVEPRHTVLRTFLAASDNSYVAMPGGLAQIPTTADALVFSLQRGAGSKDTWVQASGPISSFSMLRSPDHPLELSRGGGDLPSRVADNLFWMGRYVERAENAVRLMRGITIRLSEKSVYGEVRELPDLMRALREQSGSFWTQQHEAPEEPAQAAPGSELRTLLEESRKPGGLYNTLQALQDVARIIRDRISTDTWRVLNQLHEDTAWPFKEGDAAPGEIIERLNATVTALASFGGLSSESLTRGQVWIFMDMGRRLERAAMTARFLRSTLSMHSREEGPLLEAVLEVGDSFMTYRRRYLAQLQLAPVLDLLLSDETNPRSVAFQLSALNEHVQMLPREASQVRLSPEQRLTLGTLTELRMVDVEDLCREDDRLHHRGALVKLLTRVDDDMAGLSDIITRQFLSHAQTSRQLAATKTENI